MSTNRSVRVVAAAVAALTLTAAAPAAGQEAQKPEPLRVTLTPVGPSPEQVDALRSSLPKLTPVAEALAGSRWRLLSMQLLDPVEKEKIGLGPDRYRAVFYDYTRNRAVVAEGQWDRKAGKLSPPPAVTFPRLQPPPSDEELEAAIDVLEKDPAFGPALASGALMAYPPMPPVVFDPEDGKKKGPRTVNVGLFPGPGAKPGAAAPHEIVGVDMTKERVVRFPNGAPPTARAELAGCGPASGGSATTTSPQPYEVVITRGQTEIWRLTLIRPAASSGNSGGSAIEVRDVLYKGKKVLGRGHTPILNVKYNGNTCGPYRDWQNSENPFQAVGTDPVPGVRACTQPPQTIIESGSDSGSFKGVAYYVGASDVLFMTELTAGWYRYVAEWRFHDDGRIQPRFGFGAVNNTCVCYAHNHHAYFRFDFDIGTAADNAVSIVNQGGVTPLATETWGRRDLLGNWRLLVQNNQTRDGYQIVPGPHDGTADVYAVGDWWALRGKGTAELDDGRSFGSGPTEIYLTPFVNGESIQGQDVVVWYGVHFLHNHNDQGTDGANYIPGPELVPTSW